MVQGDSANTQLKSRQFNHWKRGCQ